MKRLENNLVFKYRSHLLALGCKRQIIQVVFSRSTSSEYRGCKRIRESESQMIKFEHYDKVNSPLSESMNNAISLFKVK